MVILGKSFCFQAVYMNFLSNNFFKICKAPLINSVGSKSQIPTQ